MLDDSSLEEIKKELNDIHTEDENIKKMMTLIMSKTEMYSSPLPSPNDLLKYKDVYEDLPKEILSIIRDEQKHRHDLDRREINVISRNSLLGIMSAFIILLSFGIMSYLLITKGHVISGSIIGAGVISSLIGTFIYGTKLIKK